MKPSSFFARYHVHILLLVVFLVPLTFMGARRALLSNHNEVKEWLPSTYVETKQFEWFLQHFAGEQFVLISWDGCTLEDPRLPLLARLLVPEDQRLLIDDPVLAAKDPGDLTLEQLQRIPMLFNNVVTGPELLAELMDAPSNLTREQALNRLEGLLVGPDHQHTCAVATLSPEGRAKPRETIALLKRVATDKCGIQPAALHLGGPPVDNVALDESGEQSLFRLAGLSALIGLVISWWCLRSGRLIALVFTTGIYSAAASLAFVYYSGSSMNAILLTMPSLVYVAALSGAIHLANYYRDTAEADGPQGAAGRALSHAKLPLMLATGTTAAGLVSLYYSELVPIQMFGVFSALGVVGSLFFLFLFLPAGLEAFPLKISVNRDEQGNKHVESNLSVDPVTSPKWAAVGNFIVNRYVLVAGACLIFMFACGWGTNFMQTSVQLMRMFPSNSRIVKDYTWLEDNLGPLIPMEVVLTFPMETELTFLERMQITKQVQEAITELDEVGSAMSAVTFSPELPAMDLKPQSFGLFSGQDRVRKQVLSKRLAEHREEFESNGYLSNDDTQELWRISARLPAMKDVDYGVYVGSFKEKVEPVLAQLNQNERVKVEAVYTGLVPLVFKAQRSLLDGLVLGFLMDLVLVIVVMIIAVREWAAGLLLAVPSVFPVAVVFGLMGWFGVIVDIGTVMVPAVALGVTVDDVVHYMLWYRQGIAQGMTRPQAVMLAYRSCARPMYQSWGVIGLGLSVFAFSPFMPTQRFGYMMITLLSAALIGNLVLLPALLASPLGAMFGRRLRRQSEQKAAQQDKHDDSDSDGGIAVTTQQPQPATAVKGEGPRPAFNRKPETARPQSVSKSSRTLLGRWLFGTS